MEFLKTIFETVGFWITDFIIYLFEKLATLIGGFAAYYVLLGLFFISMLLLGVLSVRYFRKKKYRTSTCFFIILFLMLSYIITFILNIANK
ncbi:MAG: hypothetical protein V1773_06690 [bacterium]